MSAPILGFAGTGGLKGLEDMGKEESAEVGGPNRREWDLQDVENWFETEGSVGDRKKRIYFSQKDDEPLKRIRRALLKELGIKKCPIIPAGAGGWQIWLPLEESARLAKALLPRVKTRKAWRDLERLRKNVLAPSRITLEPRRRAREVFRSS